MRTKDAAAIGQLCHFSNGHGFTPRDWAQEGLPIIRIQNLNGSRQFNYYQGTPEPEWIVESGQLLFAWAGVRGVSFGPTIWNGPRGVLNQHIYRIEPNAGIDKTWLHAALRLVTNRIERKAHGFKSSLVHVKKADITSQSVFVPQIEEQRGIAEFLSSADRAVDLAERLIAAKQERRAWLMQQLLSGKRRLRGFSGPWRKLSVGDITTESSERNQSRLGADAVRAVNKVAGMIPMKAHVMADDLDRYKVVKPTWFAYNPMRLNIGSICQWGGENDALVSPDYVVFSCREESADHRFFNAFRKSFHWRSRMEAAGNGSVRVRIYYEDLARMPIRLPSLEEQERISSVIDAADREIELLQSMKTELHRQEQGLMQQLLTGKRRVKVPLSSEIACKPRKK